MEQSKTINKLKRTRKSVLKHFPKGMTMAEIGVYRGAYSKEIVKTEPSTLYLVDIWKHVNDGGIYSELDGCNDSDKRHAKNMTNVQNYFSANPAVKVVQSDGVEFSKSIPDGHLDCVYIDGDHTFDGCLRDLRAFESKISNAGFMYGHDYTNNYAWIQVPQAIDVFLAENPTWELRYITSETPEKSPSWFLTRENSRINLILKKLI